ISCPVRGASTPEVDCQMKVGAVATRHRFHGRRQVLPILLPDLTGIHPLSLTCAINGRGGDTVNATLYLTYARPTCLIAQPEELWYRRACSWAAGIAVTASQAEIPRRILHGMYAHGQRRWRYGYCEPEGDECVF